ncbi:unnamed protein product [Pylaiella littoralis]
MMSLRTISALLLLSSGSNVLCSALVVETCQDLQDAFDSTATEAVEVEIDPSKAITCDAFTTMSMDSNTLTVVPCETCATGGTVELNEVRFEVTGGAKLFWRLGAAFTGTDLQDVDGGAVFVGEDSTARFSGDFSTADVGIRSVPDEYADFATYDLDGGCVYVDGYFRVEGDASFERCENSGGGEAPPGRAGVMYVGPNGSVLFAGKVSMSEVSIIDNEGNNGGGIYNEGKVNIKGDAVFDDLRAEAGGAIFNAEGAEFRFKRGATATFNECLSFDGIGGAVFNAGYFKLSGPATVTASRAPTFVVSSTGYTRLSEGSVFTGLGVFDTEPAIVVDEGGRLTGVGKVDFVDGATTGCATVEEAGVCLDG